MTTNTFFHLKPLLLSAAIVATLSGCVTTQGYQPRPTHSSGIYDREQHGAHHVATGRVVSVRWVELERRGPGAGAVLGAVLGAAIGNQVGDGSGRTAATIAGAAAGGYAGQNIQNQRAREQALEIVVHLDQGGRIAVIQSGDVQFRSGDRVRIVGTGREARVVLDY